jgi:hypothetical protein
MLPLFKASSEAIVPVNPLFFKNGFKILAIGRKVDELNVRPLWSNINPGLPKLTYPHILRKLRYQCCSNTRRKHMDPITAAIVAAFAVGAGKVVEKSVLDAYEGLKTVIKKKLGGESKVLTALADLEAEPDFEPHKAALQGRIKQAQADQDSDILQAAQALLDRVKAQPGGTQTIQNIQNVYGDYSAVAGPHGTATVNVNDSKE